MAKVTHISFTNENSPTRGIVKRWKMGSLPALGPKRGSPKMAKMFIYKFPLAEPASVDFPRPWK